MICLLLIPAGLLCLDYDCYEYELLAYFKKLFKSYTALLQSQMFSYKLDACFMIVKLFCNFVTSYL